MNNAEFLRGYMNAILTEELGEWTTKFIKTWVTPRWKGLEGYPELDDFVKKLDEIDPTTKKIYVPWLAKLCILNPRENHTEDLETVGDELRVFELNKAKLPAPNRNIESYKKFSDLYAVLAPFHAPKVKTADEIEKEKQAAALAAIRDQIITVYQGPEGWIRIPTTVAASKFLGQHTKWCTSGDKDNRFLYYSKDDNLFVVYDKEKKERFQLHIQSGQYADETDRNQGIKAVPDWAGKKILEYYQAHNPHLTMKQLMALQAFTDNNLAAGTPHEELFDLFKQYGV